jgi:phosphonate degradation associated HDIG domain protein
MMNSDEIAAITKEIINLYKHFGKSDYIGEKVSQIQHMTQCALLAESEGYDDEVILAAFLHDIGHLLENKFPVSRMNHFGVVDHEKIGHDFLLKCGFSHRIAKSVEAHVSAKRYLTYKYPEYYEQLSEASKATLEFQGGKMSASEAATFEEDDNYQLFIAIRKWDDLAKNPALPVPTLEKYESLIYQHLSKNVQ